MRITQDILKQYARLIVRSGANVQPGQTVLLFVAVDQAAFAEMIAEECYLAGAKKVNVEWQSDGISRLHFQYADQEVLSTVLPWEEEKAKQMTVDLPCRIYIESEDPDALAGISPSTVSTSGPSRLSPPKNGPKSASPTRRRSAPWRSCGTPCSPPCALTA